MMTTAFGSTRANAISASPIIFIVVLATVHRAAPEPASQWYRRQKPGG